MTAKLFKTISAKNKTTNRSYLILYVPHVGASLTDDKGLLELSVGVVPRGPSRRVDGSRPRPHHRSLARARARRAGRARAPPRRGLAHGTLRRGSVTGCGAVVIERGSDVEFDLAEASAEAAARFLRYRQVKLNVNLNATFL